MRAVILSGGAVADYDYVKSLIHDEDLVVCADSGCLHAAKMGVRIDLAVGDFDSSPEPPEGVRFVRYPVGKDYTDTELAIEHARGLGCREFLLLAATGTRLDHTLANVMLLKDCLDRGEYAELIDEHNRVMLTSSKLDFEADAGSLVSLIPLADCFGVATVGLEYPLDGAELRVGRAVGVSNVMTGGRAGVSVAEGYLLIIIAKD